MGGRLPYMWYLLLYIRLFYLNFFILLLMSVMLCTVCCAVCNASKNTTFYLPFYKLLYSWVDLLYFIRFTLTIFLVSFSFFVFFLVDLWCGFLRIVAVLQGETTMHGFAIAGPITSYSLETKQFPKMHHPEVLLRVLLQS